MKKKLILLTLFFLSLVTAGYSVSADDYLRVGMEAAYAPFNWTQNED